MLQSAEEYYRSQQVLAALALRAARLRWGRIAESDITGSWLAFLPELAAILIAIQQQAAADSMSYVSDALDEQNVDDSPVAAVVAGAFAGVASDGRSLVGLLDQPRITALSAIKDGMAARDALQVGRASLDRITVTQVQDAGRAATGVAITARPHVSYVRMLVTPSCARCVVLAGRKYKWNQGFQRHPKCDCRHVPTTDATSDDLATDSAAYFKSLSEADQDRIFTKTGARAIRDGADINQVVNARLGMDTAGGLATTTVGTGKSGLAGQRLRAATGTRRRVTRLMPESIYELAGGDRAEALRLLQLHGYVL